MKHPMLTMILALLFSLGVVACSEPSEGEQAADAVEEAADNAGDALEEGGEAIGESIEEAEDEMED
jgi:CHASE1-domain containing sensor protein